MQPLPTATLAHSLEGEFQFRGERPVYLTASGINHPHSTAGHDINPIVNAPAMSAEFMIIAPTSKNSAYPVTLVLQDHPSFITAHLVTRNKQIEVGMRIAIPVISQPV